MRLRILVAWSIGLAVLLGAPSAASAAVTLFVNRTDDPAPGTVAATCNNTSNADTSSSCSLREAVIKSNSNPPASGTSNAIELAAGTYTLSQTEAKNTDGPINFDSKGNELDIEVNTRVIGAGSATTIIQAGTSQATAVSLIFIINGYTGSGPTQALDATLQDLTLRNGRNPYSDIGASWGFGGAVEYESGDGGQLTLDRDVITSNATSNGDGGGVAVFDDPRAGTAGLTSTRSLTTITDTTISDNSAVETNQGSGGSGGGVFAGTPEPLVIQGSTISGNSALNGPTCSTQQCSGAGGVLEFGPNLTGGTQSSITNTTFSDNTAAFRGAGLEALRPMAVSGSTFSGNTLTNATPVPSGGPGSGAGIYAEPSPDSISITGSTFTANSATGGDGGGVSNAGGTMNLTDSRITANTAAVGSGVNQDANNVSSVTNATEDWWGCNGGPGAPGCDTAGNQNTTAGSSFTSSPWVTLRTTAAPTTIEGGGSSTLTTSFLKDSNGAALTTSQIPELIGLPVSWSATHGTISGAQTTIQSTGTATATLTADTSCTNASAEAKVDNVQPGDPLATATLTVQCPNLTASKTDDVHGSVPLGGSWNWTISVANSGPGFAAFSSGQTVLRDDMPETGIAYGAVTVTPVSGVTGTVSCAVTAADQLTCSANGAVRVNAGGSFTVSLSATPSTGGTFANPGSGGTCAADPGGVVVESSETDNACSDTVMVTAADLTATKTDNVGHAGVLGTAWTWKIHVANIGGGAAAFSSGATILTDDLPTGPSYGAATISNATGVTGTGAVTCAVTAGTLTCTAAGGTVSLAASTGDFDVSVTATPTSTGTFANPRAVGSCAVDPANVVGESDETNNTCSDTVSVTAPDLTVSKTDDAGGTASLGGSWAWKLHVANAGSAIASFASGATIVSDDLPAGPDYSTVSASGATGLGGAGTISCAIVTGTLTCVASGGPVTIGAGGSVDFSVTVTPHSTGTFTNPAAAGSCSADPGNVVVESDETNNACNSDSVTVSAPDLTVFKSDDSAGRATVGTPWTWNLHVAGGGSAAATFSAGQTLLRDQLPAGAIAYGPVMVSGLSGLSGAGTLACSISSGDLTCSPSGGAVTIASTGSFDVSFPATASAAGTFVNPRAGGSCSVDPDNDVVESDETNNSCSDAVVVTVPATVTSIACSPNQSSSPALVVGQASTCTATVSSTAGGYPQGSVAFTTTGGTLSGSPCTLGSFSGSASSGAGSASCSVTYTPTSAGPQTIGAMYTPGGGDTTHVGSAATSVTITAAKRPISTDVVCSPNPVSALLATACKATVTDTGTGTKSAPTGKVTFGQVPAGSGTFSSASCTLTSKTSSTSSCSVNYTPASGGSETLTASYGGDATHAASSTAATTTLSVTGCGGGPHCGRASSAAAAIRHERVRHHARRHRRHRRRRHR